MTTSSKKYFWHTTNWQLTVWMCGVISFGQRCTNASKACRQYSLSSSSSSRLYWTTKGITRSMCSPNRWPACRLQNTMQKFKQRTQYLKPLHHTDQSLKIKEILVRLTMKTDIRVRITLSNCEGSWGNK